MPRYSALNSWYQGLLPLKIDLVGDYAGSELFMVEGDSLLRHLWSDPRIDFSPGFQLLHAVYVVEKWLEQVKTRGCQIHLVFLEGHARFCVPSEDAHFGKYLLARKVVKEHLKHVDEERKTGRLVYEFAGLEEDGFLAYLDRWRPLFVMLHDGETRETELSTKKEETNETMKEEVVETKEEYESSNESDDDSEKEEEHAAAWDAAETDKENKLVGNKGSDESEKDHSDLESDEDMANNGAVFDDDTPTHMKGVIARFMQRGYNIALVNNVKFMDSKMFTSLIVSNHGLSITLPPIAGPAKIVPKIHILTKLKSQRMRLAVAALSVLKPTELRWASLFVLHVAHLNHLSLPQRCLAIDKRKFLPKPGFLVFFDALIETSTRLLESSAVDLLSAEQTDLCDYIDGRLLLHLLEEPTSENDIENDYELMKSEVEALSPETRIAPLAELCVSPPVDALFASIENPTRKPIALLPFSNEIFDKHLRDSKKLSKLKVASATSHPARYTETHHWHNASKALVTVRSTQTGKKPTTGGKGQSTNYYEKRQAGRARKYEQLQIAQMNRYAASLTNSIGNILEPKLVVAMKENNPTSKARTEGNANVQQERKKEKPGKTKPGKKVGSVGKSSKADIILAQQAEKMAIKDAAKLQLQWTTICSDLEKQNNEARLKRLDVFLHSTRQKFTSNLPETHESYYIEAEAMLYKILVLRSVWVSCADIGEKRKHFPVAAMIFDESRKLLSKKGITKKIFTHLKLLFSELRITVPPMITQKGELLDRKLSFDCKFNEKPGLDISLGMSSLEFQLSHCGELMDRDMESAKDDRVSGFLPDKWQREVLDELDHDNSVLVVAPTSAGKTFISFYAMDKVLRESDDGVLVYVAPTKALVNQIAAEVIARFKKNYRNNSGKTIWAIHTRDYRINNPNECQILVTVPHILQIMLLSPTNATTWAPRIKRIIFDEIHSIGNADDGVVWEQLLLLARCPIIALSATVGNPEEFSDWLANAQKGLKLIRWPYRYSDLRKHVYAPITVEKRKGNPEAQKLMGTTPETLEGIFPLNPIAALRTEATALPDDLSLEPRDCLKLYEAMNKHQTSTHPLPKNLDPRIAFGAHGEVIKKAAVLKWEKQLKEVLKLWMRSRGSPFPSIVRELRGPTFHSLRDRTDPERIIATRLVVSKSTEKKPLRDETTYVLRTSLQLLRSLDRADALPAILFSFDRSMCNKLCKTLCGELQREEAQHREKSPQWQAKVKAWKEHQNMKDKPGPKVSKRKTKMKGQDLDDIEDSRADEARKEDSWLDSFDPNAPSLEYSFADPRKYSVAELKEDIYNLRKVWGIDEYLVAAFERGIGVHHAGMNRKYRQMIEMLFRRGYLRVVIATGTLALGINAPCKTTVFSGDSIYLTALNYRQASGRAGRRGFDNIGNVIFHGFPVEKVHRIMTSKLPSLQGHFPITTSLILRLFILLENSNYSDHAVESINTLLTQPRLVLGSEAFKEQVLHHLRFSIEFLRRHQLLSEDGTPLTFAGLVSHLYYVENSAFAFQAILSSGALEMLCKYVDKQPENTARSLMLIIAHLFGRRPERHGAKRLPSLPKKIANILKKQNEETLNIYSNYVCSYAAEYCANVDDNILPYSGRICGGTGKSVDEKASARSAFVALSGHPRDSFSSMADLTSSTRSGIMLEGSHVPYMPLDQIPNAWLYEFYCSGDVRKVVAEHGVPRSDIWFVLKDISLVLATIETGLRCYLRDGPGKYFDMDETIGGEEGANEWDLAQEEEDEDNGDAEVEEGPIGLIRVLRGFVVARRNFEEKFKKMWA